MAVLPPVNLGMIPATANVRKASKAVAGTEFTCVLTEDGQVRLPIHVMCIYQHQRCVASLNAALVNLHLPTGRDGAVNRDTDLLANLGARKARKHDAHIRDGQG